MLGQLWRNYKADLQHVMRKDLGLRDYLLMPIANAGVRAVLCYRIAFLCHKKRLFKPISSMLKLFAFLTTGAEISTRAILAPGLHMPHPSGVVIGPTAKTLGHCTIFQQVTLGPRKADGDPDDGPTLGDYTYIYGGARILGNIVIGERAQIGPNCVIFRNVEEGSTVLPPKPTVLGGLSFTLRKPKGATA